MKRLIKKSKELMFSKNDFYDTIEKPLENNIKPLISEFANNIIKNNFNDDDTSTAIEKVITNKLLELYHKSFSSFTSNAEMELPYLLDKCKYFLNVASKEHNQAKRTTILNKLLKKYSK